jgi:DHA3 family macrolide efflux protein-like MFS transporter
VFRRVLPGAAASALGDGMSAVAIAWLALKLAPPGSRGLWVGAAVAAYTLPGAIGAITLRRWLRGRHGTGLVIVNAVLRGTALGLAGLVTALADPAIVIVLDAASWALLALSYASAARFLRPAPGTAPI